MKKDYLPSIGIKNMVTKMKNVVAFSMIINLLMRRFSTDDCLILEITQSNWYKWLTKLILEGLPSSK